MTSHEFARQLLAGPDLPILVPKVLEYSDDEENCCTDPVVAEEEGYSNVTESPCRVLVISEANDDRSRNPRVQQSASLAQT